MIAEDWARVRSILAVRLDNVGDVVMLGPALRELKRALPVARITLLTSPAGARAASLLPWIDETIPWRALWQDLGGREPFDPGREAQLVSRLRERSFGAAFVFTSFSQTPHVPGYVCYLAAIPIRVGASKEFGGATLTLEVRNLADEIHQVDRNLALLEAAALSVERRNLEITIPAGKVSWQQIVDESGLDPGRPFITVHPGASAEARRYPGHSFGEVARLLAERGHQVLIIGTESELGLLDEVQAVAPQAARPRANVDLGELAALVGAAACVVCNNSLPLHLADACRTPLVVLYSGTDLESQWRPRASAHRLLRRSTYCHPCYGFRCPIGKPCLDIDPAEVVGSVEALLARSRVQPLRGTPPPTPEPTRAPISSSRFPEARCTGRGRPAHTPERTPADIASPAIPESERGLRGISTSGPPESRDSESGARRASEIRSMPVLQGDPELDLGIQVRRIAIFRALHLGDMLLAIPALRAIRREYPRAEITLIGLDWAQELARRFDSYVDRFLAFPGFPGIDEAPYAPSKTDAFLQEQRSYRYDLALQMHGSGANSNGFVVALGAKRTIGFRPTADSEGVGTVAPGGSGGTPMLRPALDVEAPYPNDQPEVRRNLILAELLGCAELDPALEFPLHVDDLAEAAAILSTVLVATRPIVTIHPSARSPERRWPAERFAHLGDQLVDELGASIVVAGGREDRLDTASVIGAMRSRAIDATGRTSIGGLAALIAASDLFVGNDSGPSHLAQAVGTPSVVLFGPEDPIRWGPVDAAGVGGESSRTPAGSIHRIIRRRGHGSGEANGRQWRVDAITVEDALHGCLDLLQSSKLPVRGSKVEGPGSSVLTVASECRTPSTDYQFRRRRLAEEVDQEVVAWPA